MIHGVHPCEFPHSEISGSLAMCAYPKLIAAYHVLHRLLMPRHSPCALCSLTYLVISKSSQFWFSQRIVFNKYFISWLVVSTIYIIMCNFQRTFWETMVSQNWTEFTFQTFFSGKKSKTLDFLFSANHLVCCILHRKEVIQPQVLLRLPCYDFTPIADPTLGRCLLTVSSRTLGIANSHGVTGGVYKARERIHRDMLIRDY